jgi:hypothetical protein
VAEDIKRNATMNVVRDARSSVSRMLFVGTREQRYASRTGEKQ